MSRASGRHPSGRRPDPVYGSGDDRDIPGGIRHNDANEPTVHVEPPRKEQLDTFRGMMAHGVPPQDVGVYHREMAEHARHPYQPHDAKLPLIAEPIPVYIVTEGSPDGRLGHTGTRHVTVPAIGSEPVLICGSDGQRKSVRLLNEGTQVDRGTVYAYGKATAPLAGAAVADLSASKLSAGLWSLSATVQVSGTEVAATDTNNMQLVYGTATTLFVSQLVLNGTTVQTTTAPPVLVYFVPGQSILDAQVQAVANASAAAVYSASITATPVALSGAGIRVGDLPELAWDAQNNVITGGILLPDAMTGYLEIKTESPLYAVSMDASSPLLSIISEMEVAGTA